jgi:signal transduction histidine kinase
VDPGLAAGLVALDATLPVATRLEIDGDVSRDHPVASALYFVACEAVANSLKHAHASLIVLHLVVADGVAELSVSDDGVGAVATPPAAIVRRLEPMASTVELSSPPGRGTCLRVRVDLEPARAGSR